MFLSDFLKPKVEGMLRKGDVKGLVKTLQDKDLKLRTEAANALASLLLIKNKPRTLSDVKKIIGPCAPKKFSFKQEGDTVYAKLNIHAHISFDESSEALKRTQRLADETEGFYDKRGSFIIRLNKPVSSSHAELAESVYLGPEDEEMIAEALGKFRDDLAVAALVEYSKSSPLRAIQALSDIGSERSIGALRTMLFSHYRSPHGWVRSFGRIDRSSDLWLDKEKISALEKVMMDQRDYEGCKEMVKMYSREIHYEPLDEAKRIVLRAFSRIIGKQEIRGDKELLMIMLSCLGAFPANFRTDGHGKWFDEYYDYEVDEYGIYDVKGKRLIADAITERSSLITLEDFNKYLGELEIGLLEEEDVLNLLVTLLPEYPNTIEVNPIASALKRVNSEKRLYFLNSYLKTCEECKSKEEQFSSSKGRPNLFDIIASLKYWLSFFED